MKSAFVLGNLVDVAEEAFASAARSVSTPC
jgi:hypothetical protein